MVKIAFSADFQRTFSKIKDSSLKERILKQVSKICKSPGSGKPMRFSRKGTRELYIAPFRLSYIYLRDEDKIVLLSFYHKDKQ
jgi:mRNA-degrading endonuclease RelE of RelBE toxin-antitoxin system